MSRAVKAFLFDVHGTLIDKGGRVALADAWRAAVECLNQEGYGFVSEDTYRESYWATLKSFRDEITALNEPTLHGWYSRILQGVGVPQNIALISRLHDAYTAGFGRHTTELPGASDVLRCLRDRGYRLAAVSNGFPGVAALDLDRTGLRPFFERIVSSSEVGRRKPHPAVLDRALRLLGVAETDVIVVGNDAVEDGLAATVLGIRVALIEGKDKMTFVRDMVLDYGQLGLATANITWTLGSLHDLKVKVASGEIG